MNLDVDTLIHEIVAGQMEINFLHGDPKNSFQQESQFSIHNLVTDTNRERSVHQDSPSKNRNRYRQQQSSSQRQNKSK